MDCTAPLAANAPPKGRFPAMPAYGDKAPAMRLPSIDPRQEIEHVGKAKVGQGKHELRTVACAPHDTTAAPRGIHDGPPRRRVHLPTRPVVPICGHHAPTKGNEQHGRKGNTAMDHDQSVTRFARASETYYTDRVGKPKNIE
jgi:hypothetical protein